MELRELISEMNSMEEYRIVSEMNNFEESVILLNSNYNELNSHFLNFKKTIFKINSKDEEFRDVNIETKRLIHNYLSSVITLIDHTRIHMKILHKTKDIEEYKIKIERTFIGNPLCSFVK